MMIHGISLGNGGFQFSDSNSWGRGRCLSIGEGEDENKLGVLPESREGR